MFIQNIQELYKFRNLLWVWSLREIRIRYKQSILGGIWAILQPFSYMLIFTVIFGFLVKVPTDGIPYPIFFYSALLPWTFFSSAVTFAVPSLINNFNLVTKIYFPREIFPIGSTIAAFIDFIIASILFLILLVVYQVPIKISVLWLPILLVMQILLTLGISFLGATLIVFYRDIRFIVPLGMQLWMYITPVVYPLSVVPERFRFLYMLNPMAGIIDGYRRILLGTMPQWEYLVFELAVIISLFLFGYFYFKSNEFSFADMI
jgi:homopolymeric O-antigen transport system permease protein